MDYKEMPQLGDLNIPYYVQIYDIIYQLIQDEKLKEGIPFRERTSWQSIGT